MSSFISNVDVKYCVTSKIETVFIKVILENNSYLVNIAMSLLTYKYYDTPEGEDIFKKTFVTSKYAVLTSIPPATFDVLLYSHPKGFFQTALRYGVYLGPAVAMATAFTLTANIAQNMRG